jgi:hypothetical protein
MEDSKPEHAPAPPDPNLETLSIREPLQSLVDQIPDSDVPTVAKILHGLILLG